MLLPERMLIQSLYTYWLPLFLAPYLPLYFVKMPFFCPFYLKFCPFLKWGSYGGREGIQKKRWIFDRGHTYPGPPPPIFDRLRFFFQGLFLNLLGCWLQSETDFVKISSNFDHENLNNSWTIKLHNKWYKTKNIDKYKVRGKI